jgi:hypothetical protein
MHVPHPEVPQLLVHAAHLGLRRLAGIDSLVAGALECQVLAMQLLAVLVHPGMHGKANSVAVNYECSHSYARLGDDKAGSDHWGPNALLITAIRI